MGSAAILVWALIVLLIVMVIGYAWIDGGLRPLRPIAESVRPQAGAGVTRR